MERETSIMDVAISITGKEVSVMEKDISTVAKEIEIIVIDFSINGKKKLRQWKEILRQSE